MNFYDQTGAYVEYKNNATSQRIGYSYLLDLIKINQDRLVHNVLDVGCGNGMNTYLLSKIFDASVVGIDSSEHMLREAKSKYGEHIKFILGDIEDTNLFTDRFDLIVCNSVIHWFKDHDNTIKKLLNLLSTGGVIAIQTPLRNWCPLLITCIDESFNNPILHKYAKSYKSPWHHNVDAESLYKSIQQTDCTAVLIENKIHTHVNCSNTAILNMFNSGAAAAYFNQDNYSLCLPDNFKSLFLQELITTIFKHTKGKPIGVDYNRGYLLVKKI